jgi:Na+-transporting NADH:ubiquinone oxidoreductase subunit A
MPVHQIKKGLDVPISGAPKQELPDAPTPTTRVAIVAGDFVGMKPRMAVIEGDQVKRGQLLFEDRKAEGVRHTSPGAGTVVAVNRGAKRAFQSIVIELTESERAGEPTADDLQTFESYTGTAVADMSGDAVRALLVESGEWTALRARPYSRVPATASSPKSIFVNCMDTNPLSMDVAVVSAGLDADFQAGLAVVSKLTEGKVFVCRHPGSSLGGSGGGRVEMHEFSGPHPSGLVGTHIHTLDPVYRAKTVWHLGWQDVVAWGRLFQSGVVSVDRTIAVSGPTIKDPGLVRTRRGASLDEMLAGRLADGEQRVVSGGVLSGVRAAGDIHGYLGRYHQQVCALAEGRKREFIGWLMPGMDKWSTLPAYLSAVFGGGKTYDMTTSTNGSPRAMVPIGMYERVFPLDIMPTFLLRALLSGDLEKAEELGLLELDEEDVALCTVVCPGKTDYGPILRTHLNILEAEG